VDAVGAAAGAAGAPEAAEATEAHHVPGGSVTIRRGHLQQQRGWPPSNESGVRSGVPRQRQLLRQPKQPHQQGWRRRRRRRRRPSA
jgi:hypothetical protein